MANLRQITPDTFTFYLYDLDTQETLKVSSIAPCAITVKAQCITAQNLSLFERPVVYLPPAQQSKLPSVLKKCPGFMNYLKACNYMIPHDQLPLEERDIDSKLRCNPRVAFKLLNLSASQGFAPAQTLLSDCYKYGIEVKKNLKHAFLWLQKAAKQKYPKAEYDLGVYHYHHSHNPSQPTDQAIDQASTLLQLSSLAAIFPHSPNPSPTLTSSISPDLTGPAQLSKSTKSKLFNSIKPDKKSISAPPKTTHKKTLTSKKRALNKNGNPPKKQRVPKGE